MTKSSLSFTFRITMPLAEPLEVDSGPGDIVRLESHFNIGVGTMTDLATMRWTWLMYLAWCAQNRTLEPHARLGWEKWLDEVIDVEVLDESADADELDTTAAPVPAANEVYAGGTLEPGAAQLDPTAGVDPTQLPSQPTTAPSPVTPSTPATPSTPPETLPPAAADPSLVSSPVS
jgi:hypothetical protein